MLAKTTGIVIKTTRFSETSLIAKIYTHSHGMLSFLVPGVFSRKPAVSPSLLQVLQVVELDFYFHSHKNLLKIREIKNTLDAKDIYGNIPKTSLATVISELIFKTIKEEEQNESLFDYCLSGVKLLNDSNGKLNHFFLLFALHYTKYIGFYPVNNYFENQPAFHLLSGRFVSQSHGNDLCMTIEESRYFHILLQTVLEEYPHLSIPAVHRQNLLKHLLSYYEIHVNGFTKLKSFEILRMVFH